ncbi:MAG: monovalent cation/H+ antiporter subunit D [Candidatus Accumulibacter sp.]|nr:monovalent cation/H+ antiporter subunit D [Accumulibacter sp.]
MACQRLAVQRWIGTVACAVLLLTSAWLALLADDGELRVYALGDWPAPFGIVLVVDRLAAAMTLLVAILGFASLLHASAGFDERGRNFHALFQLQLFGLTGAFLTGDLFNLFVFFEVMLLASYTLLAHGGGVSRTRAGISYVVLNLIGSALFLIALGLLYGTLGTLNLADVAQRLAQPGYDPALARLALALLITVFALKAGLLPLSFWLPPTYTAAGVPVAALFTIMTKVGIVAILRLQTTVLAPSLASLLDGWLTTLALATIAVATLGALAASRLRTLTAWLVLLSAGTLLLTPAQASTRVDAAALYYLVHSSLAGAALFLIAGEVASRRGPAGDRFTAGPLWSGNWLKLGFLVAAMTSVGLPPFSGFVAKLMLLDSLRSVDGGALIWTVVLVSGLLVMLALARGGCTLVWRQQAIAGEQPAPATAWQRSAATLAVVAAGPLLAGLAQPLSGWAMRTATQLHAPEAYVAGVLGGQPARQTDKGSR